MMNYVIKEGNNKHLQIMLHGTGGSADSLFNIGEFIDANSTLVGIEGEVLENGMRRYFERYPDGSFKLKSLAQATQKLEKTITEILKKYPDYTVSIVGYSNGANIALNLLKEYENIAIDNALLFHPSPVRVDTQYLKQDRIKVLITSGKNDPFISELEFETLQSDLKNVGIECVEYTHDYGHQLIQEELDSAVNFISEK